MIGYYSGSERNRIIGEYNSSKTLFDGYRVQDESGQQCRYQVDGSQFYSRLVFKLNSQKEFEGLWSYCDEAAYLPWRGRLNRNIGTEVTKPILVANKQQKIQTALNFFGYNAGLADGILGKKTKNAITQIQYCWEDADPYANFVQGTREFGLFV